MTERPTEALDAEQEAVRSLCEAIGYGNVMSMASRFWKNKDAAGAFDVGVCFGLYPKGVRSSLELLDAYADLEARVEELERALQGVANVTKSALHSKQTAIEAVKLSEQIASAAFSKQEPPQEDEDDVVYDVNKCSWCVHGNHERCHGPCNCEHPEQEPREPCGTCLDDVHWRCLGGSPCGQDAPGFPPCAAAANPCPDCVTTPNTPEAP